MKEQENEGMDYTELSQEELSAFQEGLTKYRDREHRQYIKSFYDSHQREALLDVDEMVKEIRTLDNVLNLRISGWGNGMPPELAESLLNDFVSDFDFYQNCVDVFPWLRGEETTESLMGAQLSPSHAQTHIELELVIPTKIKPANKSPYDISKDVPFTVVKTMEVSIPFSCGKNGLRKELDRVFRAAVCFPHLIEFLLAEEALDDIANEFERRYQLRKSES